MNSVEKRRSRRKSGGHRKHSDGGYSDTSSGGSFLDETDREVSNLTDRAFRSLCIGDEAVYNDSELGSSSPFSQRDRQQAFSQDDPDRDRGGREGEELKRAAHESFSLRVQQYGQDWIHGGMYGAKIHRHPQWEVYGESAQGRVCATFQHSLVEACQQEESLREEQLSILTNGATELSSQHRRSRSRVSSLIRAFDSEGHNGTASNGKPREWNDETSWDKSALMNIQRELSEFSTSYQQNFNSGHFPSAGLFSSQDNNFNSSQVAAVAHMNSEPSFIRSSHSKHSMSAQVNCNSNVFIHSEFSPFKVWRDQNRFPFQRGEISGFMHCSEFPKWYETPLYKEISLEAQPQGLYRFEERGIRYPGNNLAPAVAPTPSRSTSKSTMMQKALAVEKRCESELAGQYPHRKQTQSLGTNRLPAQRPSTVSPTIEMSRRVHDTIGSVKALQQKNTTMTEQNAKTGMTGNQQGLLCANGNVIPFGNNVNTVAPNVVSCNTSTTPFSISQLLTPFVQVHQDVETSEVRQYAVSPEPVAHPPVRAESRGATPDVRMPSYKSRATSLLFNLKDNRKRVKSTYSPTKYKGLETPEKTKQHPIQEPQDIVIQIPDFADPDIQFPQAGESAGTNAPSDQYVTQYHSPALPLTALNSQPATAHTGHYSEYSCQPAQMQSEMLQHSGFTSLKPENYTSHQLANGLNLHNDLSPFTTFEQGMTDNVKSSGDIYMLKPSITNPEQQVNDTGEREFTKVDKYQRLKNDYSNVSSQDKWRQTSGHGTENLSQETAISPRKQEISYLLPKDQHPQTYERAARITENLNSPRDQHRGANQQNSTNEPEKMESEESFGVGASHKNTGPVSFNISNQLGLHDPAYYGQEQHEALKDKYLIQKYHGQNRESEKKDVFLTQNHNRYTDHGYANQQSFNSNNYQTIITKETGQRKLNPTGHGKQTPQPIEAEFEHNMQKDSLFKPDNVSAHTIVNRIEHRQISEVKAEQAMAEHIKPQHTQAELAELLIRGEPSQVESSGLILAAQTGSEKVKAEEAKSELAEHKKANQDKEEQTELFREIQSDPPGEEQTKTLQTRVQKEKEETKNMTEEIGAKQTRQAQGEHVRAEDAKAERLKVERIKTEQAKNDLAGSVKIKQTKTELIRGERFKPQQLEGEQVGGEQIRTDNVTAEKSKLAEIKAEEMTEQQIKAKQDKVEVIEDNSIQEGQTNEHQLIGQISKAKNAKVEGSKPAAKLRGKQQVQSETDRVEQVKTELAKAKAELAKMKEKMMSEQADKARNASLTKEGGMKREVSSRVDINKNEEHSDQDQTAQNNLQSDDSVVVSRRETYQVNRGSTEYERLREKYGFIDTTSTNRHKLSAEGNVLSNDNSETSALPHDKVKTTNNKEAKDKGQAPTKTSAIIGNKEEVNGFEPNESNYVYSESSKEFKLSRTDYVLSNGDRANSNAATDNVKDDVVEKLEKCDTLKLRNVSQQRDSGLAKSLHLERKSKSTEHSVGQGKESNCAPTRALSHKERVHTKQELLTSRIKAHAEKEISAIKERGFATRDGLISKTSSKQLAGSLNINARRRPSSQEVSKNQEGTLSSNITPKQQMEPPGAQAEPVMSPSSATKPANSAANTSDLANHMQEQVRKEPMSSSYSAPKPNKAKQTGSNTTSTDERLFENQRKESKEQTPKKEGQPEDKLREISGKQTERLQNDHVVNTDHLNKANEDPPQSTALVKAQSSVTETSESKYDGVHEYSVPSLNTGLYQAETPVADDSLQIMGIMVTVRERKPSVNGGQRSDGTPKQMNAQVKEPTKAELDTCHSSSGIVVSKGNEFSNDLGKVKAKDIVVRDVQKMSEAQTEVDMNGRPGNVQETSTPETRRNNISESVSVENTALQQGSSCNEKDTQPQEPLARKSVPSAVSLAAEVSPETQPSLYTHDMRAQENKICTKEIAKENSGQSTRKDVVENKEINTQVRQITHGSEEVTVEKGLNHTNDSNRVHAETLIKHDAKPSMKEDTTRGKNKSKSRSTDGKNSPPLDEKRHDLTPKEPCDKTSPSYHLTGDEPIHVSPEHQYKDAPLGEDGQMDSDVHIGSVPIRLMPAATEKDDLKMAGRHHVTIVPSDVAASLASSSHEEKVSRIKDPSPASNEKQMQDSVQNTLGVQSVVSTEKKLSESLKISNQQNNINTNNVFTQMEKGKPESGDKSWKSVSESNTQLEGGDYFQVQGVVESNNKSHNCANVGDTSDVVPKATEPPGLFQTESNGAYSEGTNGLVMDQSKMKTAESSSSSDEDMNRKHRKTGEHLAFSQSYGPTETQSHKTEKREAGQVVYDSEQYRGNQSRLSAKERLSSRNPNQTRETLVKEKADVNPKAKERVLTIPEISALADYARLKVIVSQDQENTIQEFPPSKKEGFFPLIQTRHSRRPVFTADPQDLSVKEKSLPNKREGSSKVNKEPKPLVFPITDKEHQRTGMFKLGDKDRQEKTLSDAKTNDKVLETGTKHAQPLMERNKLPTNILKNQRGDDAVAGGDTQRQTDQIHQSSNPALQASSLFAVNRSRNTYTTQHPKSLDNSNPHGYAEGLFSKAERTPILEENSSSQPTRGQEENKQMSIQKDENNKSTLGKTGGDRSEKLRQERLATLHGDSTANQSRAKQLEKELAPCTEVERRAEDLRIKYMIEESRASQAEEDWRATRREEEWRARERKAIASEIKERRERRSEEGRRAEEERKAKQTEEQNTAEKEKLIREKQDPRIMNETGETRRAKLREEEERLKVEANWNLVRHRAQEEQQRRSSKEDHRSIASQEGEQRRAAHEQQQRRAVLEEQQRRDVLEEQQRMAALEEQQRRAVLEEQQRRAVLEEQQRRAVLEEQQRRAVLEEQHRRAKQTEDKIRVDIEQENQIKPREADTDAQKEEIMCHTREPKRADHQIEEQRSERQRREEWLGTQREEEERRAVHNAKTIIKARQEKQPREERTRFPDESQAALKEGANRVAKEQMQGLTEDEIRAKRREEEDKLGAYRERTVPTEEQKRAAQRMDALQYYAITSTESERKPREKQLCSPLPSQQRNNPSGLESIEDSHTRPYRPHAPASPAPSLPRSNTSSPALGTKPSMFRVKDITIRGSNFTKSVKPRFHKNFAEDFRAGSPMGSERAEEDQESARRSATTPHPDTGSNRLATIKESLTFQTAPSSQNYLTPFPHHRPYNRRSFALDEDDSRSVVSNMSEDVESFATSAADLADVRGLYDYERPESACSFSSDVSRSLGKPPVVPPKSEKALRRAQRLTTRRIKKELSKAVADKPPQEVSSNPSSSSTEVRSVSRHAVASPHCSQPFSLAHAPRMDSGLSSCPTEHPSAHSSSHASSNAAGPNSLTAASPHAIAPVSLPVASPHAPGLACHPAAPKTIADVPSSPTLHHANHPAPVTQYHVESTYPQSYPLTQRKVLQDLGSGQYFVVDVPVEVKMKTFFDPETGKYVQLNVRESSKSASRPQPQLQPQVNFKPQQQSLSQDSAAGKSLALFQGYHGYPQSYQPAAVNSLPHHRPSVPGTHHQTQQPVIESHVHKYPSPEIGQGSKVHHYSPEKTPYMDTVNDTDKTYNTVHNRDDPYQSFPESDTDSKLVGSSACENDNSAHSRYQHHDIIPMSELEDFMELSDW